MIISGGANVFPAEVESALIDHAAVADVVVIGYAKSRLASYKVPKTIEIADSIPRSEATKVNRGALTAARGG
jgi:bile acid-coenzyme A ligase